MLCWLNMDIQTSIDATAHLTTFTLKGELDFDQLLTHIKGIHVRSEHTSSCLYDLKSIAGGERVSVLQIGRFYELCGIYFYGDQLHKIAFLVNDHMDFVFAQAMKTFEELHDVYLNIRTFRKDPDCPF